MTRGTRMRGAVGLASAIVALAAAHPASAHLLAGDGTGGFAAGFAHPLTGLDHLLAMVSVGIWGAELGAPAIWLLPIAFPLVMAVGGALGVIGVPLPGAEWLIALSVLVLGGFIAYGRRVPLGLALVVVGVFAIAHGHAHGTELPASADALAFTVGFVLATGMLHLAGIGIGLLFRFPRGIAAIRGCGLLVALAGGYFILGHAAGA